MSSRCSEHYSRVAVGDSQTAEVGDRSLARAGKHGTSVAGDYARSEVGPGGYARAGVLSCAISGTHGRSETLERGYSHSGDGGISVAGEFGLAVTGIGGRAAAGPGGIIEIATADGSGERAVISGFVGDTGLRPNVYYEVRNGELIEINGEDLA